VRKRKYGKEFMGKWERYRGVIWGENLNEWERKENVGKRTVRRLLGLLC